MCVPYRASVTPVVHYSMQPLFSPLPPCLLIVAYSTSNHMNNECMIQNQYNGQKITNFF
jgi:hypothetical protein